jgi:hypothetical protein
MGHETHIYISQLIMHLSQKAHISSLDKISPPGAPPFPRSLREGGDFDLQYLSYSRKTGEYYSLDLNPRPSTRHTMIPYALESPTLSASALSALHHFQL